MRVVSDKWRTPPLENKGPTNKRTDGRTDGGGGREMRPVCDEVTPAIKPAAAAAGQATCHRDIKPSVRPSVGRSVGWLIVSGRTTTGQLGDA